MTQVGLISAAWCFKERNRWTHTAMTFNYWHTVLFCAYLIIPVSKRLASSIFVPMQRNPPKRKTNGPEPKKHMFPNKAQPTFYIFHPKKDDQKHPSDMCQTFPLQKTHKEKPNNIRTSIRCLGLFFPTTPPGDAEPNKKKWTGFSTWAPNGLTWHFQADPVDLCDDISGSPSQLLCPESPTQKSVVVKWGKKVDWWEFFLFMKLMG